MSAMGLFALILSNQLLKSCLVPNHLKTSVNHPRFTIATLSGKGHVALGQVPSLVPPLCFFPIFSAKEASVPAASFPSLDHASFLAPAGW